MKGQGLNADIQRLKYVAGDLATGCVAFLLFNMIRYLLLDSGNPAMVWRYISLPKLLTEEIVVPVLMLGTYWLSGYYNKPFGKSRLQEFLTTFMSALINTSLIYLTLLINDQTGHRIVNYEVILTLFGLLFLITYPVRLGITLNACKNFQNHQWEFRALVIGNSATAHSTAERLVEGPSRVGYHIVGFVPIPGEKAEEKEPGGDVYDFSDIKRVCASKNVDQIIISQRIYDEEKVLNLLYHLFPLGIPIKIMPDTFSLITSSVRLKDIYGEPFVDLTSPSLSEASKNIKRVSDVVISALVLVLLSPLYAWLAFLIRRSSKGPVFYSQERIGLMQRPFNIYKFRTMREDAEAAGPSLSSENDPRITPIGKTLRKYRLDELPQFWNVLKGDMSIVGPRPERAYYIDKIMKKAPYYALVYNVRPGITSWGMVKYGYASTVEQMVERTRFDLIYISNMSLFVDIKILIYTVKTVVTGRGV